MSVLRFNVGIFSTSDKGRCMWIGLFLILLQDLFFFFEKALRKKCLFFFFDILLLSVGLSVGMSVDLSACVCQPVNVSVI